MNGEAQRASGPHLLSAKIKERALGEGFCQVGIVPAEALGDERARLEEWLKRGLHGEMAWMARDPGRRTDPRQLLDGARAVVCVALNYFTPHRHSDGDAATGKISRYAWGDDYHDVLGEKLRALLAWIKTEVSGAEAKSVLTRNP